MKTFFCLSLVLVIVACSSENYSQVDTFIEDGVEVVQNYIEPYLIKNIPSQLIVRKEFSIDFEREDLAEHGISEIYMFLALVILNNSPMAPMRFESKKGLKCFKNQNLSISIRLFKWL